MIRITLFALLACLMIHPVYAEDQPSDEIVYIIPVKGTIEPALLYVIRRGVDEAINHDADAIIFEMDTPGGSVDATEGIINVIFNTDIPTYTFIEKEAYSAGAIIALSTPNIYMAPGSVIGAATPLLMSSSGGVQELPESVEEKMTSAVAAMVRATAERGGYDPMLAEAMVRADMEYSIDGEIISEKGRLLTLTDKEASRLVGVDQRPLLSKGTFNNIDELLEELGLENADKRYLEVTAAERFARLIALPQIATLLMICGFGGLWLEFKTPGFGIFGILGTLSLLLLFFGHHLAGLAGYEDALILMAGIAFLALEIFVIPGFGLAGISGVILIMVSLLSMMIENMPGKWRPIEISHETFAQPIMNITVAFIGTFVLALVAGKFLSHTRVFRSLTLAEASPKPEAEHTLLGLEGTASSDLRPSGSARFGDRKIDVVTYGDYIPRQSPVRIVEVHGNRIVVESISHT